jgi:hypothetical protein
MESTITSGTTAEIWDQTFSKLGRSAPARRADENETNYQRRLARIGGKYIPAGEDIARVDFAQLPDSAVPKFAEMMRAAVERNITRTDNMQPGELRAVHRIDPVTGYKCIEYVGKTSFVLDPTYGHRPGRHVLAFNAPQPEPLMRFRRPTDPRLGGAYPR